MASFLAQWRGFTLTERRQYLCEIWALASVGAFMFLIGFTFAGAPSMAVFNRIGGSTTARLFAFASLVCVLLTPLLLVKRNTLKVSTKRWAYILLMLPMILYSSYVFLFARDTGNVTSGVIVYLFIFNALCVVGVTLYREG